VKPILQTKIATVRDWSKADNGDAVKD